MAKTIAKELKRPDQFVDFWTRASHKTVAFLAPRRKPALAALVALVVLVVGATILDRWDTSRRESASHALVRIQELAVADLLPAAGTTPPASASEPTDVARFKTADERRAAVLKELDAFLGSHGRTKLKDEALIMKGKELLSAGRYDDAISTYREALSSKLPERLAFLAHEGLGYAFEEKGNFAEAEASFARISDPANSFQGFYRDRALYHRARIAQRKGDKPAALKLYREAMQANPDGPLRDEITDRLALLEAK